jgi:poly(3-hydroxybutyrate) depolymerase
MLRTANERRLSQIDTRDPRIFQAWVACRARNALLSDRPSEDELGQYFIDPLQLQSDVEAEIQALQRGEDPYVGRTGEHFRAIPAGAMYIPAWVYAPPSVKDGKPMPVVIALHGAVADESIFMQGYGSGEIKRLANERGFIVVAPSTYWVMPNPSSLEGITAAIGADYPIDRSRIYVIGHSLGAMAAASMAARHPKELAGAALIAGRKIDKTEPTCPVLVLAAELDPLVPVEELRKSSEAAAAAGLPVEFRQIKDAGHVLACDEALEEAIAWLLEQHNGREGKK